jgi:hypothetical protein
VFDRIIYFKRIANRIKGKAKSFLFIIMLRYSKIGSFMIIRYPGLEFGWIASQVQVSMYES